MLSSAIYFRQPFRGQFSLSRRSAGRRIDGKLCSSAFAPTVKQGSDALRNRGHLLIYMALPLGRLWPPAGPCSRDGGGGGGGGGAEVHASMTQAWEVFRSGDCDPETGSSMKRGERKARGRLTFYGPLHRCYCGNCNWLGRRLCHPLCLRIRSFFLTSPIWSVRLTHLLSLFQHCSPSLSFVNNIIFPCGLL